MWQHAGCICGVVAYVGRVGFCRLIGVCYCLQHERYVDGGVKGSDRAGHSERAVISYRVRA